jgi:hypothetical protein
MSATMIMALCIFRRDFVLYALFSWAKADRGAEPSRPQRCPNRTSRTYPAFHVVAKHR